MRYWSGNYLCFDYLEKLSELKLKFKTNQFPNETDEQKKVRLTDTQPKTFNGLIMNLMLSKNGLNHLEVTFDSLFDMSDIVLHTPFNKDKVKKYVVNVSRLTFKIPGGKKETLWDDEIETDLIRKVQ